MTWKKVYTRSIQKNTRSDRRRTKPRGSVYREVRVENGLALAEERAVKGETRWVCRRPIPSEASSTSWAHRYLPTSRLHLSDELSPPASEYFPSTPPWMTEEHLDALFARSVQQLWSQYSAQVLGVVRKAQEQGLARILSAILSPRSGSARRRSKRLTAETAYSRVRSFLERQGSASILVKPSAFERQYAGDRTLQDVVNDIDEIEDRIKVAMTSRDMLQELITRMFRSNKEICFTDQSIMVKAASGEEIGLALLSSGEKHLLRIFVELLLIRESSLMIDEPEISMHIDWQRDLIRSLRALNPDAQLIIATHSPEVMADVSDEKIFRL